MRKIILATFIGLVSVGLLYGVAYAAVSGPCVNCHTMHASQDGTSMLFSSDVDGDPNEALTRAGCIGCHGQDPSGTNSIIDNIPQVWHNAARDLAAGNFKYVSTDAGAAEAKGHNVTDLGVSYQETTLTSPPGDELNTGISNDNFTCAGKYGCHGDRSQTGNYAGIKGAHHTDDGTIDGNSTGTSYRFLKGVLGLENNATYPWENYDENIHNEYKGATGTGTESTLTTPGGGTISGLCAICHGDFHYSTDVGSASPWLRHPTDIVLPASGEYASYNEDGATYSTVAPVARVDIPTTPSSSVTPGTNDAIVMCLSCHGAHGTNYNDILRWDYSTIVAGGAGGNIGCFICHTQKD